jgi:hypothetical protein
VELSQGTIFCEVLAFQSALEAPVLNHFILEQSADAANFADNIFTSHLKVSLVFLTLYTDKAKFGKISSSSLFL